MKLGQFDVPGIPAAAFQHVKGLLKPDPFICCFGTCQKAPLWAPSCSLTAYMRTPVSGYLWLTGTGKAAILADVHLPRAAEAPTHPRSVQVCTLVHQLKTICSFCFTVLKKKCIKGSLEGPSVGSIAAFHEPDSALNRGLNGFAWIGDTDWGYYQYNHLKQMGGKC